MPQRPLHFGAIEGVFEGQTFSNRRELFRAGLHRHTRFGISGIAEKGCNAVVLSQSYEDDCDAGDTILYTGEGGRHPKTGKQIAPQVLTGGNLALWNSFQNGHPIRVIRGANPDSRFAPEQGFRYDGLYCIARAWSERGKSRGKSGFVVWRFELRKIEEAI